MRHCIGKKVETLREKPSEYPYCTGEGDQNIVQNCSDIRRQNITPMNGSRILLDMNFYEVRRILSTEEDELH